MSHRLGLAFIFMLLFQIPVSAMTPIKLISENWPPYNFEEKSTAKGYSTEIVKLIMKELNIKADIAIYPGSRAMQVLNNSKRTMFFSLIRTPKREDLYKWIGPFGHQNIPFYKRKGSPLNIKTIEDAKKVDSICCRNSGFVLQRLKSLGFKNLDLSKTAKTVYLKSILGRCDLAITETPLGYSYWMKDLKRPQDSLEMTPVNVTSTPLYIVATKDIPNSEIELWQKALKKVLASKAYIEISKKYGL